MSSQTAPEHPAPSAMGGLQRAMLRLPIRQIFLVVLAILLAVGLFLGIRSNLQAGVLSGADYRSFVVDGIARGALYAVIAVGYTLVYGILFLINFAHGEVFMAGAFTSFFVARTLSQIGFLNDHPFISIVILLLVSMAVSTITAILLERIAYRRLRGAPRLIPLITAIGASLFLQNTFRALYGANTRGYPVPESMQGRMDIFGIPVLRTQTLVIVGAALLMIGLYFFIERTKTGRSMRAVGEDREIASLMGINVDRVIVQTFAIGGMLAGAAGVLWAMVFGQVDFFMGFFPGIKAFTAAVLGGIGNIVGAGLGGLLLGVLESLAPYLFISPSVPSPNQLTDAIAFTILVLILIFRPGGILGSSDEEKA
ncbi:MAG: branched-chain amino acid ABC transporter permease [Actinomycetota bacterium]|nr:branched-chain amino acid ABC transporter permease [Actinomycetota bacterium]